MPDVAAVGTHVSTVVANIALVMSDVTALGSGSAVIAVAHVAPYLIAVTRNVSPIGMNVAPVSAAVNTVMPQIAAIGASIRSQSKS